MPPTQGELSPAAWQCYSLVNLTRQVLFIPPFLSYKTTNVPVIGAFSSVDVCGSFDFITKWMWSVERVSHSLAEPQSRKLKLILL